MAKNNPNQKAEKYAFPSYCGSHTAMLDKETTDKLNQQNKVVCKDNYGFYITEQKYLDSGMNDPYRTASEDWREKQLSENGLGNLVVQIEKK